MRTDGVAHATAGQTPAIPASTVTTRASRPISLAILGRPSLARNARGDGAGELDEAVRKAARAPARRGAPGSLQRRSRQCAPTCSTVARSNPQRAATLLSVLIGAV